VTEALTPTVGWGVLHLFCKVTPSTDASAVVAAVKRAEEGDHQVVTAALLGHKADLAVMSVGPDMWRLHTLQADLQSAGLALADSYVSLTEISEYAKGLPAEMLDARLHPKLPPDGKPAFCFYPMSKRRNVGQNWFSLPYDERLELMHGHGKTGRTFAGRVLQLITGSTGLDDWEWGVTLLADDPTALKEIVYDMRFDEVSAQYADFGPFVTGLLLEPADALRRVGIPSR
jgi:hydrogen peroxide-dependent heme synthase